MSQKIPYQIIFYIFFLVVLFFGVYIRFDDTRIWEQNSAFFFYKGEPLYSEYDSFYFARYALDMKEGLLKVGRLITSVFILIILLKLSLMIRNLLQQNIPIQGN